MCILKRYVLPWSIGRSSVFNYHDIDLSLKRYLNLFSRHWPRNYRIYSSCKDVKRWCVLTLELLQCGFGGCFLFKSSDDERFSIPSPIVVDIIHSKNRAKSSNGSILFTKQRFFRPPISITWLYRLLWFSAFRFQMWFIFHNQTSSKKTKPKRFQLKLCIHVPCAVFLVLPF